jgi:hypothetical protein
MNLMEWKGTDNALIKGTFIDIFGNESEAEVHPGKFFVHLYGELYNVYNVHSYIDKEKFLLQLVEKYNLTEESFLFKNEYARNKRPEEIDFEYSQYIIKLKEKLLLQITVYNISFWYSKSIDFNEITEILEIIGQLKTKKKFRNKFYMVAVSPRSENGLELNKYKIKKEPFDLAVHYNDDFLDVNNTISEFLVDDSRNGLILLHGKYGTGKTSYLRHLISTLNKRFIFLPVNLMDAISSPNFLPFISRYKNSILILEDCEELLEARGANTNSNSLVNLLNIADGLLSDALSLKIICTFNANIKQIDQAVLRKGRLVARYEFNELDVPKSKTLLGTLGYDDNISKPMTLAEIYHSPAKDFGISSNSKKIGF